MSHENKNYLIAALFTFSLMLLGVAFYQKSVIEAFTSSLKEDIKSMKTEKNLLVSEFSKPKISPKINLNRI